MVAWSALILFLAAFSLNLALVPWAHMGWYALPCALAGWFLADLSSGLVHVYMDFRPCTPGVGLHDIFHYSGPRNAPEYLELKRSVMAKLSPFERVAYDFKSHHPRPSALGRRSFPVLVRDTIIFLSLPGSLLLSLMAWRFAFPGWLMVGAISLMLGGTLSQYIHGSLHRDDNPIWVTLMRRAGLLMTPEAHGLHHATLDRDFATLNGWSNTLVNVVFRTAHRLRWVSAEGLEPR